MRRNNNIHDILRDVIAIKFIMDMLGININNRNDYNRDNGAAAILDKILILALGSEFLQAFGEFQAFPVTSVLTIAMIFLHFEYKIRGAETIPNNNYNKNTMQANAVLNGEYHRIWTSVLLHVSNTHLFLNLMAFKDFATVEQTMGSVVYLGLLALIVVGEAIFFIIISKRRLLGSTPFQHGIGFSGVIFGLLSYRNHFRSGMTYLSIPIKNNMYGYYYQNYLTLPVSVPAKYEHLFQIAIAYLGLEMMQGLMRREKISHAGHAAGAMAGYVAVAVKLLMIRLKVMQKDLAFYFSFESFSGWAGDDDNSKADEWLAVVLLLLVAYVAYNKNDSNAHSDGDGDGEAASPTRHSPVDVPAAPDVVDSSPEKDAEARRKAREASLRRQKEAKAQARAKKFGISSSPTQSSNRARDFGSGSTGGAVLGGNQRDAASAAAQRQEENAKKNKPKKRTGGGVSGLLDMRENIH